MAHGERESYIEHRRGAEYWSRRPGPTSMNKNSKKITHKIERARERQTVHRMSAGQEA